MSPNKPKTDNGDPKETVVGEVRKKVVDVIAATLAAFILTGAGVFFTPLGEVILDWLPQKGSVALDGPEEVLVGKPFSIDPFITPIGSLRHAILRVKRSANIDQLPRQAEYRIGKIAEEAPFSKLHGGQPLQFQALEVGTAHILCDLLSGNQLIASATPRAVKIVRHHTYEGEWTVKIADTKGAMHLEAMPNEDASVYGYYKLSTGIAGFVNGTFDGAKFTGVFSIGNAPSRYELIGDTVDHEGSITVIGDARACSVSNGRWQLMAAAPLPLTLKNDG